MIRGGGLCFYLFFYFRRINMRKTIVAAIAAITLFIASACTGDPKPVPSPAPSAPVVTSEPTVEPSESVSEAPTNTDPAPTTPDAVEPTTNAPEPTPTVTTDTETPQVKFIKRWRAAYPDIDEPTVLGAARDACERVRAAGDNWELNADVQNDVSNYMVNAGFPESIRGGTATAFAKDALQNAC
jgi:type IV secretory pathway VirB10-like protein